MSLPTLARIAIAAGGLPGTGGRTVGATLTVQSNVRAEIRKIDRLTRTHAVITARSLNLAARKAKTETVRELAADKNVPQRVLRKRVQAYKAHPRQQPIRASLWVGTARPIKAKELGNVEVGAGGVRIGKRRYKQAFRATMPTGHTGIFTRKPHARHQQRPDGQMTQLPIQESVVQLLPEARDISRRASEKHVKETYPKEAARLMRLRAQRGF